MSFSTLVLFPLHEIIGSVTTDGRLPPSSSATLCRGGLSLWPRRDSSSPQPRRDFFPWAGPSAQCSHRHGPTSLLPRTIAPQNPAVWLLGEEEGFGDIGTLFRLATSGLPLKARASSFAQGAFPAVRNSFNLSKPRPCCFGIRGVL